MGCLRSLLALHCSVLFFLCCSLDSSSSSSPPTVQGLHALICDSRDRDALVGFSRDLASGVPGWTGNVSSNCCLWPGVRCGVSSSANNSGATEARVVVLELWNKTLEGALDGKPLVGLTELRTLNLSQNSLRGNISAELFRLPQLEVLDISSNSFSGELSGGIRNLSNLRHLDVSYNDFSGTIPNAFGGLSKLQLFSARANNFTGRLPASLSSCSMLTSLDLGGNSLTGRIELNFTRLVRLRTLRLDLNRFVGRIPRSLSSCRELEILNLARNSLHGQVPLSFKYLQALSSLSLANNDLSDVSRTLAVLSECRNLTVLVLSANFRGETMPGAGIRGFKSLKILSLADCHLFGHIPDWLRTCVELTALDLSYNYLEGYVPPWLDSFTHLVFLDLSNNLLGGVLPDTLANLNGLPSPNNTLYSYSIGVPFLVRFRGRTLQFTRFIPPMLVLSSNGISGPILKGFGNLTKLIALNLSHNSLSGSIPGELSFIRNLESLDLSHNNLSGSIPSSLVGLSFLSDFSVAHNDLQGRVPEKNQFSTFSNSSYQGNPGLPQLMRWKSSELLSCHCHVVSASSSVSFPVLSLDFAVFIVQGKGGRKGGIDCILKDLARRDFCTYVW